jgi:hypothetical protein
MNYMEDADKRHSLWDLAVLCFLRERPMHPYEMSTTLRERGKQESIKLNFGSLYSIIEALLETRLIAQPSYLILFYVVVVAALCGLSWLAKRELGVDDALIYEDEPDPIVRQLLAENFDRWTGAVLECLEASGPRLPGDLERGALAQFVLTTMEGGVMQSRTHRDVAYFDRAVGQLRSYFAFLEEAARVRA